MLRDLTRAGVPLRPFGVQADIQRIMNSVYSLEDVSRALRSVQDARREVIGLSTAGLRDSHLGSARNAMKTLSQLQTDAVRGTLAGLDLSEVGTNAVQEALADLDLSLYATPQIELDVLREALRNFHRALPAVPPDVLQGALQSVRRAFEDVRVQDLYDDLDSLEVWFEGIEELEEDAEEVQEKVPRELTWQTFEQLSAETLLVIVHYLRMVMTAISAAITAVSMVDDSQMLQNLCKMFGMVLHLLVLAEAALKKKQDKHDTDR